MQIRLRKNVLEFNLKNILFKREREGGYPQSAASLHPCQQWPVLGQAKARSKEFNPVAKIQSVEPSPLLCRVCITRKLESGARPRIKPGYSCLVLGQTPPCCRKSEVKNEGTFLFLSDRLHFKVQHWATRESV